MNNLLIQANYWLIMAHDTWWLRSDEVENNVGSPHWLVAANGQYWFMAKSIFQDSFSTIHVWALLLFMLGKQKLRQKQFGTTFLGNIGERDWTSRHVLTRLAFQSHRPLVYSRPVLTCFLSTMFTAWSIFQQTVRWEGVPMVAFVLLWQLLHAQRLALTFPSPTAHEVGFVIFYNFRNHHHSHRKHWFWP